VLFRSTAYAAIDSFLIWEKSNRGALPASVKDAAAALRVNAPKAFKTYYALSKAYKTAPSPTGKLAVDKLLAEITAIPIAIAPWLQTPTTATPITK
jgi:hypothetical protein